jgi:thiol-disulfide isomerase/thioredoxin
MALVGCSAALAPLRPAWALRVGDAAPGVPVEMAQGPRALPVAAAAARVTYVDFWASWCGPCRLSFPWMNEMHERYGASGLQIVAVNVDPKRADAETFLARNPARFAIAYDRAGALAKAADVKAMPTSMLLDARGRVQLVHEGFTNADRAALEAAIAAALRDESAGAPKVRP